MADGGRFRDCRRRSKNTLEIFVVILGLNYESHDICGRFLPFRVLGCSPHWSFLASWLCEIVVPSKINYRERSQQQSNDKTSNCINYRQDGSSSRSSCRHSGTFMISVHCAIAVLSASNGRVVSMLTFHSMPSAETSARRVWSSCLPTCVITSMLYGLETLGDPRLTLCRVGDIVDIKANGAVQKGSDLETHQDSIIMLTSL